MTAILWTQASISMDKRDEPARSQRENASGLLFLDVSDSGSTSIGKDARRLIRSHVTRVQHRKRRELTRALSDSLEIPRDVYRSENNSSAGNSGRSTPINSRRSSSPLETPIDTSSELTFLNSDNPSQAQAAHHRRLVRAHATRWQHRRRRELDGEQHLKPEPDQSIYLGDIPEAIWQPPDLPAAGSEMLVSRCAAAFQDVILQDSSNVLGTCLHRLGLAVHDIVEHYIHIVDVHAPSFDGRYNVPQIVRNVWIPFILSDPALICAIILVAVLHHRWSNGDTSLTHDLINLKNFVYTAVNGAIEDPNRACSDQLVVAVFNLAIVEALFGSKDIYHIHMKGLMHMLDLRGGIGAQGYEGYVEQMILWYDVNCADVVGCEMYLHKRFPTLPEPPPPDRENFSGGLFKR